MKELAAAVRKHAFEFIQLYTFKLAAIAASQPPSGEDPDAICESALDRWRELAELAFVPKAPEPKEDPDLFRVKVASVRVTITAVEDQLRNALMLPPSAGGLTLAYCTEPKGDSDN